MAASAVVLALAITGCGTAAASHPAPAVTRTITKVVTRTITRTITKTVPGPVVTRTVDVPGPSGVPCYVDPGAAYPLLQPAGTGPWTELTCSFIITDVEPQALAEEDLTITATGYGSETYLVTVNQ
jgi:hypothetical protein